jgi:glutathione S-transferase
LPPLPLLLLPGADAADKSKVAANLTQLTSILDEAEQQLGRSPYLAGQEYSIADVMFTPLLFRLGVVGKTGEYLKPRPKVSDYFNRSVGPGVTWWGGGYTVGWI